MDVSNVDRHALTETMLLAMALTRYGETLRASEADGDALGAETARTLYEDAVAGLRARIPTILRSAGIKVPEDKDDGDWLVAASRDWRRVVDAVQEEVRDGGDSAGDGDEARRSSGNGTEGREEQDAGDRPEWIQDLAGPGEVPGRRVDASATTLGAPTAGMTDDA